MKAMPPDTALQAVSHQESKSFGRAFQAETKECFFYPPEDTEGFSQLWPSCDDPRFPHKIPENTDRAADT